MPLAWNDIKARAQQFAHEWANETAEHAEAKSFWDDFFQIFGVTRRRVASFEQRVKKIDGRDGYVDLLWKGTLLVEQKSRGKSLDRAYTPAIDYFPGLKEYELPRYILVSDFARMRLYDLEDNTQVEFALSELVQHIHLFGFIAGYHTRRYQEQDLTNVKAAEQMGRLHDKLKQSGYAGHELEVYLVRLVFCLFAEHTGIFEINQFQELIEQRTAADGSDLGQWLAHLFEVLNTPNDKRSTRLDEQLAAFAYINGQLYVEHLPTAAFDRELRDLLLAACALDWGRISPAIFGALFQAVMAPAARRQLGAHYTSEVNILKLIGPLFLDELRAEWQRIKRQSRQQLFAFQQQLAAITLLDPACGCGNFLVIAYRELRLLELEVLQVLFNDTSNLTIGVGEFNILCNVNQCYGIEIEEFPAQIARTALWLTDHQMNQLVSQQFGKYYARIPLTHAATIVHGNALQLDWRSIIAPAELTYILGNPPFVGKKEQNALQKADFAQVFNGIKGARVLDFVAAWFIKSTDYMADNPAIKSAFVATNSITQGEQVGVLWSELLKRGAQIHFAHRTFQWSNEASGQAVVHCVMIGFALHEPIKKRLFVYENVRSEAKETTVNNINPYLVDAPNVVITRRSQPICHVPPIVFGSMANDGGHLLLSEAEKQELIRKNPQVMRWIRPFSMGNEFINAIPRYCLWLIDIAPNELRQMPDVLARVNQCKQVRLNSTRAATNKLAASPTLFGEIRQPDVPYLAIPCVSSERRRYIPIGFLPPEHIAGDKLHIIPNATLYHFGVLSSAMHIAWMRTVTGRLKSDYQYSNTIVYNNFPWPDLITDKHQQRIETAAQALLIARQQYPDSSLAALYDPLLMPPPLVRAHRQLDAAVDAAYSQFAFNNGAERVALLFNRYQQLTAPMDKKRR
ncbi:class I SAM-dependent DNA methyltransferase [Thiospirillum jenense]|uniref:site-specific DNA-methyltransferase (adenine-specific) n=1 Tax=Thiospirillum jenense TaxID=1653858 RepID=A0A839H8P5_9GAMM|nr:class I SAM-dependent DNA methyltransferase [Thiospirillum jenense]MBB1125354.1 class I SAM-dependent DNA methyltransferase [Thiospirillum jenense]